MKQPLKESIGGYITLRMKYPILRCVLLIFGAVEIYQGWKHADSLPKMEGVLWETLSQSKSFRYGRYPKKCIVGSKNVALYDADAWRTNETLVNTSATAQLLPGSFLNNRLYLMGARLTTSYDDDSSVILTIFGLPGQGRFPYDNKLHCKSELSSSIWSFDRTRDEIILYAQLDCHVVDDTSNRTCGPPIEMSRMETRSWDGNIEKVSLIWQANLSQWLDREDLRLLPAESQLGRSIRVHFSVRIGQNIHSIPDQTTQTIQPLLTVDIPLATGSVGNVGPVEPLRQSNGLDVSFFSIPPMGAALCVATFGKAMRPFLLEFVQHHRNVGFEQIILGVLDSDDSMSAPMSYSKSVLSSFVDDGSVVLVPAAAPGMECHTELLKITFYNSCLYYTKGISQYVGVWDVDEFWIPQPTNEEGTNEGAVTSRMDGDRLKGDTQDSKSSSAVMDAMTRLANYHQRHGCDEQDWCFHGFPAYTVHRKQTEDGKEIDFNHTTKHLLVDLFERRDKNPNRVWLKSIAQTKYTYFAGYHEFGSCRRPNATNAWDVINPGEYEHIREQSYEQAESTMCRNFRTLGFGSMHHFKNLVVSRGEIPDLKNNVDRYPKDEYIQHYGHAVAAQLLQTNETSALSVR